MTIEEKLNELGYKYSKFIGCYIKETTVRSEKTSGDYSFLRSIGLTNDRPLTFTIEPYNTILFTNMDIINEFYNVLRNEYYDTKKEFESLKSLELSPKERLDDFTYEIINCEDDDVSIEELASYKRLLKDLEELERRRKSDVDCNKPLEFNKAKE